MENNLEIEQLKKRLAELESSKTELNQKEKMGEALKGHVEEHRETVVPEHVEKVYQQISSKVNDLKNQPEDSGQQSMIKEFLDYADQSGAVVAAMALEKVEDNPNLVDAMHDALMTHLLGQIKIV